MRQLVLVESGLTGNAATNVFNDAAAVIALNPASLHALERAGIAAEAIDRYTAYGRLDADGEAAYGRMHEAMQAIDTVLAPLLPAPLTGQPVASWLGIEMKVLLDSLRAKAQQLRGAVAAYAPQEVVLVTPSWPPDPLCGYRQYRALLEWYAAQQGYALQLIATGTVNAAAARKPPQRHCLTRLKQAWQRFSFPGGTGGRDTLLFADTDYCLGPLYRHLHAQRRDLALACWPATDGSGAGLAPAVVQTAERLWLAHCGFGGPEAELLAPAFAALLRKEIPRLARARHRWLLLRRRTRLRAVLASHGLCVHAEINALANWAHDAGLPFIVYQHGGLGCSYNPHLLHEVTAVNSHLLTYGDGATRYAEGNRRGTACVLSVGNNRMPAA